MSAVLPTLVGATLLGLVVVGSRSPRAVRDEEVHAPPQCHHEPGNFAPISNEEWSDLPPIVPKTDAQGWSIRKRFERVRLLAIVEDSSAPLSPPYVIRATFPKGSPGGSGPFRLNRRFDQPVSSVYMCLSTRLDPNFTNNGNTGTKFGWFLNPSGGTKRGVGHYFNLAPRLGVNLESYKGILNRNMQSSFSLMRGHGEWHKIELLVSSNSNGQANGVVRLWADDALVLEQNDVKFFFPGQEAVFTGVTWNPQYGGGHNPVPFDMYQWIDHWYVSGS